MTCTDSSSCVRPDRKSKKGIRRSLNASAQKLGLTNKTDVSMRQEETEKDTHGVGLASFLCQIKRENSTVCDVCVWNREIESRSSEMSVGASSYGTKISIGQFVSSGRSMGLPSPA